jgi:putative protease
MSEVQIGTVEHYFDHIGVAAIEISDGELCVGDTIHIKGHTTDLTTAVSSMQIEHAQVEKAGKGDAVGIKVDEKVRQHDTVFKVTE